MGDRLGLGGDVKKEKGKMGDRLSLGKKWKMKREKWKVNGEKVAAEFGEGEWSMANGERWVQAG